jgi:hypothetical protein
LVVQFLPVYVNLTADITWLEKGKHHAADLVLPSGRIMVYARVFDRYGAASPTINHTVIVSATQPRGRRQLASTTADDAQLAHATKQVTRHLQSYRVGRLSQAAGALAIEATTSLPSSRSSQIIETVMSALHGGSLRSVPTSVRSCAILSTAAKLADRYDLLGELGTVSGGGILSSIHRGGQAEESFDVGCAADAVRVASGGLMSMKRLGIRPSVREGVVYMQGMVAGLDSAMVRAMQDAVAGEMPQIASSQGSHSTSVRAPGEHT